MCCAQQKRARKGQRKRKTYLIFKYSVLLLCSPIVTALKNSVLFLPVALALSLERSRFFRYLVSLRLNAYPYMLLFKFFINHRACSARTQGDTKNREQAYQTNKKKRMTRLKFKINNKNGEEEERRNEARR